MNDFQQQIFSGVHVQKDGIPIVISSRIRLARNLSEYNFVKYACKSDLRTVSDKCERALLSCPDLENAMIFNLSNLKEYEKLALVERHLCSPEFIADGNESKLICTKDHLISIMINEEDHLRMQIFRHDLNFRAMFEQINQIDDYLSDKLNIAFDFRYGFLTSCPMNVGTGMRASVMLHLPALTAIKQINSLVLAVQKLGFVVRGMLGEGSDAQGNFFQISNQQTLGLTEVDILSRLAQIIKSIIDYENNARGIIKKEKSVWLYDNIGRAIGILRESYTITSEEAIERLSLAMLAVDIGLLPAHFRSKLSQLIINIQDAHIQVMANKPMKGSECEIKRAEVLRQFFISVPKLAFE